MFQHTEPTDDAPLMRVSEFQRYLSESERDSVAGSTRLSSLNPSLLNDLQRFANTQGRHEESSLEVLEVLAAAVRHGRSLLVHLQHEYRVLPLTVFPAEHRMHCPVPLASVLAWRLTELRVLHVEPARLASEDLAAPSPEAQLVSPLGPLLWELALRGGRAELLPEIAGIAAYRVAPGADLSRLDLAGTLAAAVVRLRKQTTNLREMTGWPGFDRERAMRMLNGLYLHAALMVSRTHPAATNADWSAGDATE